VNRGGSRSSGRRMSRYSTDASKVMKLDLGPSHQEQIRKMYTGRREEKRVGPT